MTLLRNTLPSVSEPARGNRLSTTYTLTSGYSSDDVSARSRPKMSLMGAPVAPITEASAVKVIIDAAEAGRGHWTITANLDHLRRYSCEPIATSLIDGADLVVADGMPVIWASRLAGDPLPERVSGSSMVWSICEAASARGLSIFLLGGAPSVAERAASVFRERYQNLEVVGTACPPMGFENDEQELDRLVMQLIEANPRIVLVALGFPKQDLLIRRLRRFLPNAAFLGIGISLSYATGDLTRAPVWICNLGLEWAYRLSQEPTRPLARRYLAHGLPFSLRLLMSSVLCRMRSEGSRVPRSGND